jgi:hypothetical protein
MATLLKTDGTHEELQVIERPDKTSLQVLQEAVGGYIEAIYFPESQQVLFVNEEGALSDLPRNVNATDLARGRVRMARGYIQGNAVLCTYKEAGMHDDADS